VPKGAAHKAPSCAHANMQLGGAHFPQSATQPYVVSSWYQSTLRGRFVHGMYTRHPPHTNTHTGRYLSTLGRGHTSTHMCTLHAHHLGHHQHLACLGQQGYTQAQDTCGTGHDFTALSGHTTFAAAHAHQVFGASLVPIRSHPLGEDLQGSAVAAVALRPIRPPLYRLRRLAGQAVRPSRAPHHPLGAAGPCLQRQHPCTADGHHANTGSRNRH
jgi:hypothetical protein